MNDRATHLRLVEAAIGELSARSDDAPAPALKSGSGDGTSDGMEARVAHLEATVAHMGQDVSELRSDMKDVRDRLTRIETMLDHLPSKGYVWMSAVVMLAGIAALVTFQGQIQAYLGVPPTP